jgi:hypothetical protein
MQDSIFKFIFLKKNSVAWVRERTIPTDRANIHYYTTTLAKLRGSMEWAIISYSNIYIMFITFIITPPLLENNTGPWSGP